MLAKTHCLQGEAELEVGDHERDGEAHYSEEIGCHSDGICFADKHSDDVLCEDLEYKYAEQREHDTRVSCGCAECAHALIISG